MGGHLHGPGEGERHSVGPAEVTFKATADQTGGSVYVAEGMLPGNVSGPPPHTHAKKTDMFYVLEGTLSVLVGEEWHELAPGSFACAPPGVVHAFRNDTGDTVRFLNLSTPGGFEEYMRDMAEAVAGGGITPELLTELGKKHDVQLVE